jgi:16S rRNA U516 pseudouridylate synthase RsuA-like enzyme
MTGPAEVRRVGVRRAEVIRREGRNRQLRRMAEAIGNRVSALRRVRFGPIALGDLPEGAARRLTPAEHSGLASYVPPGHSTRQTGFGKMGADE